MATDLVDSDLTKKRRTESPHALPVVDFGPFLANEGCTVGDVPTAGQLKVAAQIDSIMSEHGFLFLENLGIDSQLLTSAFGAARSTFSQPEDGKAANLAPWAAATNGGYSALGAQSANRARPADLRESISTRTPRLACNDYRGTAAEFGPTADSLWGKLEDATRRFSIACALALGLPAGELDFFSRAFESHDNSALVFVHYPPCDFESGISDGSNSAGSIRVGEHADFGLFTFLFLESGAPGLQVRKAAEGEGGTLGDHKVPLDSGWIHAPGRGGGCAVVNSGALLARWTNDRWRATTHRVVVRNVEEAGEHRYSIPFFAQPDKGTTCAVHPLFVPIEQVVRYPPIAIEDFLQLKLKTLGGS